MKPIIKFSLLLALLLPANAGAYDFEVDGIYYNIRGTNAMVTYKGNTPVYNTYFGDVIIPSEVTYNGATYPVTAIGRQAFWGSLSITSVTIPNSVTTNS